MKTKKVIPTTDTNPLADIISEKAYTELLRRGLLNKIGVRNHRIKSLHAQAQANGASDWDAIEKARSFFPYLVFETVRKIVKGKW